MAETLESVSGQVAALSASVDARFEQVDKRFEQVDKRFEQVDKRFEQVDKRFETLEKRVDVGFAAVDEQFTEQRAYTEFAFGRLEHTMHRVERKLDQFIETQLQTNQLVDRRLRALESPRRRRT
jgi:hypothetical protein